MIADYITMKKNENKEVFDSNPPSNLIKIVEIFKQIPLLLYYDLKTIIKKLVNITYIMKKLII